MYEAISGIIAALLALMQKEGVMIIRRFVTSFVLLLILANSSGGQELKKIRIGYPSLGFRQGHIWVARDEGLFKKYGLDVEPVFLRGDNWPFRL